MTPALAILFFAHSLGTAGGAAPRGAWAAVNVLVGGVLLSLLLRIAMHRLRGQGIIPTRTIKVLGVFFLIDLTLQTTGFFMAFAAGISVLGATVIAIPVSIVRRRFWHRDTMRCLCLLAFFLLGAGLVDMNRSIAADRARTLVHALDAFHRQHQAWPRSLEALVDKGLLDDIPSARPVALTSHDWRYGLIDHGNGQHPHLGYVVTPPFGRRWLCMDASNTSRRWHFRD